MRSIFTLFIAAAVVTMVGCGQTVERPRALGLIHDPEERDHADDERLKQEIIAAVNKDGRRDYPFGPGPFYAHYLGQIDEAIALIRLGKDKQAEMILDQVHEQLLKDIEESKRNLAKYPAQEAKRGQ